MRNVVLIFIPFLLFSLFIQADQEAGNRTHVTTMEGGVYYAKSIPSETYGLKGKTKIFRVEPGDDVLVRTYDWYSPQIFLYGYLGTNTVYVVQIGPWNRGRAANQKDLAIAFYKDEKLLKSYSTSDIVTQGGDAQVSVSHYTVFSKYLGFQRPFGNKLYFEVEGYGGTILAFDTDTGLITNKNEQILAKQIYDAEVKISALKYKWYEENGKDNDALITEDMLKKMSAKEFPDLPSGYKYIPDSVWKPVMFQKK